MNPPGSPQQPYPQLMSQAPSSAQLKQQAAEVLRSGQDAVLQSISTPPMSPAARHMQQQHGSHGGTAGDPYIVERSHGSLSRMAPPRQIQPGAPLSGDALVGSSLDAVQQGLSGNNPFRATPLNRPMSPATAMHASSTHPDATSASATHQQQQPHEQPTAAPSVTSQQLQTDSTPQPQLNVSFDAAALAGARAPAALSSLGNTAAGDGTASVVIRSEPHSSTGEPILEPDQPCNTHLHQ